MSQMVDLVIFGGTGDLSTRKLLPALFQLHRHKLADRLDRIIVLGRTAMDTDTLRSLARENLVKYLPTDQWDETLWDSIQSRVHYSKLEADTPQDYSNLAALLDEG